MNLFRNVDMKNEYFFTKVLQFVVIIFFISSCDSDEDIETFDLTGSWKVVSFDDYEASTKYIKQKIILGLVLIMEKLV